MNTNKETARNLLDVRIILAVLWVAGMLSSLNGDTYRLSAATGPIGVNPKWLSVFAAVIVGHVFMSVFDPDIEVSRESLGKPHYGIFYAVITLVYWVMGLVSAICWYELVWVTGQLVFALLVVWYAWKWTNPEG